MDVDTVGGNTIRYKRIGDDLGTGLGEIFIGQDTAHAVRRPGHGYLRVRLLAGCFGGGGNGRER
jgi:hypothetical protein